MYAYKASDAISTLSPIPAPLRASNYINAAVVRKLPVRKQSTQSVNQAFLTSLNATIELKIDEPDLGIRDLMAAVHLSHSQLFRRLKAITGTNPTTYIRNVRLEKAHQLLMATDTRVSEIAYSLGFTDPNYFSRAFRKKFGCSPVVVREDH